MKRYSNKELFKVVFKFQKDILWIILNHIKILTRGIKILLDPWYLFRTFVTDKKVLMNQYTNSSGPVV